MKKAVDSAARLAAADQAYQQGEIRVASRLIMSVVRTRPATPITLVAKQRLSFLAEEAREKTTTIDTQLVEAAEPFATSERLGLDGPLPKPWKDAVASAFADYDQLAEQYDALKAIRKELKEHIAQKRQRPEYAAVLNEPEARALCDVAEQHQQDQQACCAYWVYHEAAKLAPAPSARDAAQQLARWAQDPQLLADAESCRQMREYHKLFSRAESVEKMWPSRAQELLAMIVQQAPSDSEVYRAAKKRIETLAEGPDIRK